ncbi:MAG: hypothetical protein ABIJ39_13835 [Chloroflexota bacterium]
MSDYIRKAFSGYASYNARGQFAFMLHRIAGLATLAFLTLHIATTATVFFMPQWYDKLVVLFRNPVIMVAEILIAYFVVYHGVNGLRIAYLDLFRPDLWTKQASRKATPVVLIIAFILWLPALAIMGYQMLKYGFGLFGGG